MAWITPKTNWTTADGISYVDLNRIEGDVKFIADNPTGTLLRLGEGARNVAIGQVILESGPRLVVAKGVAGGLPTIALSTIILAQNNLNASDGCDISAISGTVGVSRFIAGTSAFPNGGRLIYSHANNYWELYSNNAFGFRLSSNQNLLIKTTSDTGEGLHIGSGGMRVTGTTDNTIVDATGLLLVNRISESTALAGITLNHTLKVDTIAEKTASSNVRISEGLCLQVGVRNIDQSNITSGDIYNAISPYLTTVGDSVVCSGAVLVSTTLYFVNRVKRITSSSISVFMVSESGVFTSVAAIEGSTTVYTSISISW